MTTNAFIFSWDCMGIESIVPITQYENWEKQNLIRVLKEEKTVKNPLDDIVRNLILRARYNPQRFYEIYAIDCDTSLDEKFWKQQWESDPQGTAELIRARGHKLYSDRRSKNDVVIE